MQEGGIMIIVGRYWCSYAEGLTRVVFNDEDDDVPLVEFMYLVFYTYARRELP